MQPPTEHAHGTSTLASGFLVGAFVAVAVLLVGTLTAFAADMIKVQGESMTLATGISVVNDSSAEPTGAGKAIRYTANATARKNVTYTKGATQIVVRAQRWHERKPSATECLHQDGHPEPRAARERHGFFHELPGVYVPIHCKFPDPPGTGARGQHSEWQAA
jgi:hypothetical protein